MTNSSTRSQSEKPKKKMKSIFCNRHSDTAFRLLVICLVVIGLIMLLSASYPSAIAKTGDAYYYVKRQLRYAVLGLACKFRPNGVAIPK